MTIHWTEAALEDLRGVEAFIARRSPRYARGVVERLFDRADLLSSQPLLGPSVPGYEASRLRELFESPYRLIYRVTGERIEIIAVVHGARRLPRGLGDVSPDVKRGHS